MEKFFSEETRKTPRISFDPASGEFEITGRSFPQDAFEFYNPLFEWLEEYSQVPLSTTRLKINSDYFDTASYKCFLNLIKKLENIQDKNHSIGIYWYYEADDEETKEAGEDLKEVTDLMINMKELKSGKSGGSGKSGKKNTGRKK